MVQLQARDPDSGDYGKVTYLLDRMSSQGKFAIHPETGSLTVADTLDCETKSSYVLVIEAWDNYQFGYTAGESRNAFKQIEYVNGLIWSEIVTNCDLFFSKQGGCKRH